MVTLAINTASSTKSVALLAGRELLCETTWSERAKESEKLLPSIEKLLKRCGPTGGKTFRNVERIIVVSGHGSFSAVRVGVTIANTLAHILGVPLYSIDTETMWSLRIPFADAVSISHAGRDNVLYSGKITRVSDLPKHKNFYGDITDEEKKSLKGAWIPEGKVPSFGRGLADMMARKSLGALKKEKIVKPFYLFPPLLVSFPQICSI